MAWCWYIAGAYATLCLLVHVWRKGLLFSLSLCSAVLPCVLWRTHLPHEHRKSSCTFVPGLRVHRDCVLVLLFFSFLMSCCSRISLSLSLSLCLAINRLDVKDKHVMVTGGSEGLGLAVASQLASMGARVSLVSRSTQKLEMAKSQVRAAGTNQRYDTRRSVRRWRTGRSSKQCTLTRTFFFFFFFFFFFSLYRLALTVVTESQCIRVT